MQISPKSCQLLTYVLSDSKRRLILRILFSVTYITCSFLTLRDRGSHHASCKILIWLAGIVVRIKMLLFIYCCRPIHARNVCCYALGLMTTRRPDSYTQTNCLICCQSHHDHMRRGMQTVTFFDLYDVDHSMH